MNKKKKVLVSLVTHSAYKDVCENFIELFDKNWEDCKYDFRVLVIGNEISFDKKKVNYYGRDCSLPEALYLAMSTSDYDYCISFLGDAFIDRKIDSIMVESLINDISEKNIEYCNFVPRIAYRFHKKLAGKNMRYISTNDSYNMSFVAFIASRRFVLKEFADRITDLDFERKYLNRINQCNQVYNDRVILTQNLFGLVPGIYAGKWDRHSLKRLQKDNPEIVFTNREKISNHVMIRNDFIKIFQIFASRKQRIILKKILSRLTGAEFATEF